MAYQQEKPNNSAACLKMCDELIAKDRAMQLQYRELLMAHVRSLARQKELLAEVMQWRRMAKSLEVELPPMLREQAGGDLRGS